jgi:hypothetical protein
MRTPVPEYTEYPLFQSASGSTPLRKRDPLLFNPMSGDRWPADTEILDAGERGHRDGAFARLPRADGWIARSAGRQHQRLARDRQRRLRRHEGVLCRVARQHPILSNGKVRCALRRINVAAWPSGSPAASKVCLGFLRTPQHDRVRSARSGQSNPRLVASLPNAELSRRLRPSRP